MPVSGIGLPPAVIPEPTAAQYPATTECVHDHYDLNAGIERYLNICSRARRGSIFSAQATNISPTWDDPRQTITDEDGGSDTQTFTVTVENATPVVDAGADQSVTEGDLVAFRSAGAYGAVMSSEYNTRPLIPEVLVNGHQFAVIRPRPSYDEIIARDVVPAAPFLSRELGLEALEDALRGMMAKRDLKVLIRP